MDKILKLQKKALRIISNSNYLSHSAPIFKNYNLLNVSDSYELELSTFMYKHFTNQLPEVFNNYFVKNSKENMYCTRNIEDYKTCQTKTMFAHKAMRNAGPKIWNSIDVNVKSAKSVRQFRSQIKGNIISTYV